MTKASISGCRRPSSAERSGWKRVPMKKGWPGQLHGADLVFRVEAGEAQAGGLEAVAIGGIRTIVAVIAFMGALSVKDDVQLRSRGEPDFALLADQRAGEGSDDELGGGSRKLVT